MPDATVAGLALLALPDGPDETLYCLLDAASGEHVLATLRSFAADEYVASLYDGAAAAALAAVAPYLAALAPYLAAPEVGGKLLEWLSGPTWDTDWGVFVWSEVGVEEVRAHFRRLAKVQTEDGRTLLFRYYDPRVLLAVLETCDPGQTRQVFGPVKRFGIAVACSPAVVLLTHRDGLLERTTLTLQGPRVGVGHAAEGMTLPQPT